MAPFPTDTECLVCKTVFVQPRRGHGGGRHQKYCSAKCRSLDWSRGNAGKRKATILKYENKPESKEKKKERTRKDTLKRRGLTEAEFTGQLVRQNYCCYGCLTTIDRYTSRMDHDHKTGRFRGLLCDHCNWALGRVKDSAMILRRLGAYLDYTREKTCVYLIGQLKNPRVPEIGNMLRQHGYDVMDEWFTPGEHADTNWQEYEKQRGRSYGEALRGRAATNIFMFDRAYLDLSDVVILVAPAGRSAMIELGYAAGRGKRTIIFLDGQQPDRYDVMPGFAGQVCDTEDALLAAIQSSQEVTERTEDAA